MRVRFGAILSSLFRMADGLGSGALLSAAKADDLKAKYPELASDIDVLAESDPTPQKKYLDWSVKMLRTGVDAAEIVEVVKKYHEVFDRLRGSDRDISSFRSLRDMKDAVSSLEHQVSKSAIKKKSKKGADILYEDDRWQLVHPTTMDGAIYYGHNTSWCVARRDKENNYFNSPYTSKYNVQFYFLIDKEAKAYNEEESAKGGHHFSKLAMMFSDGAPYQKEKFQDAANREPTESQVRSAFGADFDKLYSIAHEHAKKHKETPLYRLLNARNKDELYKLYEENKEEVDEKGVFDVAIKQGAEDLVFEILEKNYEEDRAKIDEYFINRVVDYINGYYYHDLVTPSTEFIDKVFELVAKHKNPNDKELNLLEKIITSSESSIQVIIKIAEKYGDFQRILDVLSESKRASADAEVMSALANSIEVNAREIAARNENTPVKDLKKLVYDSYGHILIALASNKSIFKDETLWRSVVSKKDNADSFKFMPWQNRKIFALDLITAVLSNGACPDSLFSELMDELMSRASKEASSALSTHSKRPENYVYRVLDSFSEDTENGPLSTSKLLAILKQVTDGNLELDLDSLSMRLVSSPITEPAVYEDLYKAIQKCLLPEQPSYVREDALRALVNLADSQRTPPNILAKTLEHEAEITKVVGINVDKLLARNPVTPAEAFESIIKKFVQLNKDRVSGHDILFYLKQNPKIENEELLKEVIGDIISHWFVSRKK